MKSKTKVVQLVPDNKESISTAVVVSSLEKKAQPYFSKLKKIDAIKSQADFDEAGLQVKMLKEIGKEATREEETITKPIADSIKLSKIAIKKAQEHFEPFQNRIGEIELDIKLKMSLFLEANKKKVAALAEKFETGGVSVTSFASKSAKLQVKNGAAKVRQIPKLEIVDEKKIPREFLLPDEASIFAALKEGVKVPGCKIVMVDNIAI